MGKRRRRPRQASMWISASELPRSAAHLFYERSNRILDEAAFDAFIEQQCEPFYAPVMSRPSLAPGRYCRLLLLGYFEGLDSECAMAWRAVDSLSIRSFLQLELHDPAPDHLTISRTRRRIDLETHAAVFTWILQRLADAGLVERPFAHFYETGALRRVHLRGHANILKRVLVHGGGFNLGLLMHRLIGVGAPRGLQGRLTAAVGTVLASLS